MIVRKTWERSCTDRKGPGIRPTVYTDVYDGWFLFGLIPLFINRSRTRI